MSRYFLRLAYLGARFHGWQVQPDATTVQSVVEGALSTLAREPVSIVGAGRTDAGVNASMMVAHADLPDCLQADTPGFLRAVNSLIGRDIAVYEIRKVHPDAHARFDATSRTYHYYTSAGKAPFAAGCTWRESKNLDFEAMNRAAQLLLGTHDFTSFSKLHTDVKTNICTVTEARWLSVKELPGTPGEVPYGADHVFRITADRFLRNMVRAIVGTLVDVGRGKYGIEEFSRVIESRNRCAAGTSMPGEALFLHNITYPYISFR